MPTVSATDFVPYGLEDFAVIIPHSFRMEKRWQFFWPRYIKSVPPETLENTIVVYHYRDGSRPPMPKEVKAVEKVCSLYVCEREGHSAVWPFMLGLEHTRARIVARVHDDIDFQTDQWVQQSLEIFNEEPHLKILGAINPSGPKFSQLKSFCYAPWVSTLLRHGDYTALEYVHGCMLMMNRVLWLGIMPHVLEYTQHFAEDIYISLLARADGIPIVHIGRLFWHRGKPHQDIISGWDPKEG